MICPADLKPCIDDLCYGGGCLRMGGETMLSPCYVCGNLIPSDGSEPCDCDGEPEYEPEDDDETA